MKPREPMKVLCIVCGETFLCYHSKAMFCSDACRVKGMAELSHPQRHARQEEARLRMEIVKKRPADITAITAWQAEHKRLTGKWLGYHQAVEQMRKEGWNV